MTEQTIQLIEAHQVKLFELEILYKKDSIIMFEEYDEGFLFFIKGDEYDLMFSGAINNKYGFKMWRDLIRFIDNKEKPIMVSFGTNQERLFKASERYSFETLSENVILIK